jgi:hypothetical protein
VEVEVIELTDKLLAVSVPEAVTAPAEVTFKKEKAEVF